VVTSRGLLTGKWIVEDGAMLGTKDGIEELSRFFNEDGYVVGDLNTKKQLTLFYIVNNDLNLIVMTRNEIHILFDPGQPELSPVDIVSELSKELNISSDDVVVTVLIDDNGDVSELVVFIRNPNDAVRITEEINNLDKGNNCSMGILCRSRRAEIVEVEVLSYGSRVHSNKLVSLALTLVTMFWTIK